MIQETFLVAQNISYLTGITKKLEDYIPSDFLYKETFKVLNKNKAIKSYSHSYVKIYYYSFSVGCGNKEFALEFETEKEAKGVFETVLKLINKKTRGYIYPHLYHIDRKQKVLDEIKILNNV